MARLPGVSSAARYALDDPGGNQGCGAGAKPHAAEEMANQTTPMQ